MKLVSKVAGKRSAWKIVEKEFVQVYILFLLGYFIFVPIACL